MRLAVIGTGHVGLVTCATLGALGHEVTGVDQDKDKIAALQGGQIPFFEAGLKELVAEMTAAGRLRFTNDIGDAVKDAQAVFLCVGTPPRASGEANLIAVERAARSAARHMTAGSVMVEKSTVPSGTARRLSRTLRLERRGLPGDVRVASNPEFLREGTGVQDSLDPDRVLVGAESEETFAVMRRVYAPLIKQGAKLIETDIATAEISKHACNAFLALKISYINAIARLCELADADVDAVAAVMGSDPRIGDSFLSAGLGYGGYCFPKDIQAFARFAAALGYDFSLLHEVERINEEAVDAALNKVRDALWNVDDKRVALLGLAFKGGTDDTRFSPALKLAERLIADGAEVRGYDPQAADNAVHEVPDLKIADSIQDCVADADCVVVATDWLEFKELDLVALRDLVSYPIIVDARNLLDAQAVSAAGFSYYPMGKRSFQPALPADGMNTPV